MKYLVRNSDTNVVEMVYDMPVTPTPPLEVVPIAEEDFKVNMLNSIFISLMNWKPYPLPEDGDNDENYWRSNGTTWIDPRTDEEVWDRVRRLRNTELGDSDWTQLDDSPLTPPEKAQWTAYRAQMRNIPNNNPNDPRAAETSLKNARRDDKPQVGRNRDT